MINDSIFFFFFWKGSTFSDAGSDGTQPASCVDIQNRQSMYSCRCPMYGACQMICSAAPRSQFDVGARPHLCMDD